MNQYNWQLDDWPHFHYSLEAVEGDLLRIAEQSGLIRGKLSHLVKEKQQDAMTDLLVEEIIHTSQIEGEKINRHDVRSSIMNKLGLSKKSLLIHDKRAKGITELVIDARQAFNQLLTENMLQDWHLMLFSSSPYHALRIGAWRIDTEPMQIVSGHHGKWKVHFEAPPAKYIPKEMEQFIEWFNETAPAQSKTIHHAPVRAAIAHLYFESIHPFEDGNGRIGRVLSEKALSQGFGFPVLFSLSQAIELNRKGYYNALHAASRSNDVTGWIQYFVRLILTAQNLMNKQVTFTIQKAHFFSNYQNQLNERELKIIKKLFQAGINGFEGGMSAKKYMIIADTSKATATRDLQHLVAIGALTESGAGRSVRYQLKLSHSPSTPDA